MKRAVLIGIILTLLGYGVVYAAVSEVVKPVPAIVTLISALPGDADNDGNVNAVDITKVERIIVGLDTTMPGADANMDGSVNALDITKVEIIIAGLE